MRKKILLSGLCALLLVGCASSGPRVSTISSPGVDLTNLETFNYLPTVGTDRANGARTPLSSRLMEAMNHEMAARGLRLSDRPDLLIDFNFVSREGIQVRQSPSMSMHTVQRSHWGSSRSVWAGYQTTVRQYTEGTFLVDIIDVENATLRRILDNPEAMAAVGRIEGWSSLGNSVIETIINKSEKVKELKKKAKNGDLTTKERKQLTAEEKEYKSKRKLVQEKLIKFATRIPAFMYLTDFRENTLQDVITKLEPELFRTVTGLTVEDFHMLVRLRVFNTEQMNQAVFAFRRYEDASLRYTGIESHEGLRHYGLYDTVVAKEQKVSDRRSG